MKHPTSTLLRQFNSRNLSLLLVVIFNSFSLCQVSAQTIVIDDFSDPTLPGWTPFDVTSLTGEPWGPSILAVNGKQELVLANRRPVPINALGGAFVGAYLDAGIGNPQFTNGTYRTRLRIDDPTSIAGLLFRMTGTLETGFNGYSFHIEPESPHSALGIRKVMASQQVNEELINLELPFGEDLFLEASAVADVLSLKVWPMDEPEPASPQLTWIDNEYFIEGTLGVFAQREQSTGGWFFNTNFHATFDDLTFTPNVAETRAIPEPTSALLVAVILATLLVFRRQTWHRLASRPVVITLTTFLLANSLSLDSQAQVAFDLGDFEVSRGGGPEGSAVTISIPAGVYNHVELTTDWTQIVNAWSIESVWSLTNGSFASSATTMFADPGKAPNSAFDGDPVTLQWNTMLDLPLTGNTDATLLPYQFCCGDGRTYTANWSNTVLTLTYVTPPTAPQLDATLGVVASPFQAFSMNTSGDFDTELGVYPAATGVLIAQNDDDPSDALNPTVLSAIEFPEGLPTGEYIAAIGGFNTIYEDLYNITTGTAGGNFGIDIAGTEYLGSLGTGNVAYVGFTIADPSVGDFDTDTDTDGADFLNWQRGESPIPLSNSDLATWQANFGAASSPLALATVPEPTSLLLALTVITGVLARARHRRASSSN